MKNVEVIIAVVVVVAVFMSLLPCQQRKMFHLAKSSWLTKTIEEIRMWVVHVY